MKIVADANAFFSSWIRKGLTRRLWFHPDLQIYCPEFLLVEFAKHERELFGKCGVSVEDSKRLQKLLLKRVRFVRDDELKAYLPAAVTLTRDDDDLLYLACALAIGAPVWSNDKGFKGQKRVMIFTTAELAREIGLL